MTTTPDGQIPSFEQYLSRRRLPATAWGDFIRHHLRLGTFPDVSSWGELRAIVETCREFNIDTADARSSWSAFQSMLRATQSRPLRPGKERFEDLARKLGVDLSGDGQER